jgi:uncharacterized membrane protein
MNKTMTAASLAFALGAAMTMASATASAASHGGAMKAEMEKEKCYGVAMKGKNDCKAGAGTSCAGTSKTDHQGSAWSFVPKGTCEKTASPTSASGKGQLAEFKEKKA